MALNEIKINYYIHIFIYLPQRHCKVDKNISDWEIEVILTLILWHEWLQTSSSPRSDLVQLLCIFNKGDSNTHKPRSPACCTTHLWQHDISDQPCQQHGQTVHQLNHSACSEESWLMARTRQRRLWGLARMVLHQITSATLYMQH